MPTDPSPDVRERLIDALEKALPPYLLDLSGYGHVADAVLSAFPILRGVDDAMVERALARTVGVFAENAALTVTLHDVLAEGIQETGIDAAPSEIARDILTAALSGDPK